MKNLKFIFILLIILNVIVTILGSAYLSIKQQAEFYRIVIHINVFQKLWKNYILLIQLIFINVSKSTII